MGFGAVGIFMLIIVLLFYGRMFAERNPSRKRKNKTDEILEKTEIFESLAKDDEALTFLNEQIKKEPTNQRLLDKRQEISKRLSAEK
jgi:hypothetical protein